MTQDGTQVDKKLRNLLFTKLCIAKHALFSQSVVFLGPIDI